MVCGASRCDGFEAFVVLCPIHCSSGHFRIYWLAKLPYIPQFPRQLKESVVRPPKIPSLKGSAFLADMRSHKKIFHQLAEFRGKLRGPGTDSPEGVENDLRSTANSQNKSHFQDHLDERMTPRLSIQDGNSMCQACGQNHNKCPRLWFAKQTDDDHNSMSLMCDALRTPLSED